MAKSGSYNVAADMAADGTLKQLFSDLQTPSPTGNKGNCSISTQDRLRCAQAVFVAALPGSVEMYAIEMHISNIKAGGVYVRACVGTVVTDIDADTHAHALRALVECSGISAASVKHKKDGELTTGGSWRTFSVIALIEDTQIEREYGDNTLHSTIDLRGRIISFLRPFKSMLPFPDPTRFYS